jgi:hypothetical protein
MDWKAMAVWTPTADLNPGKDQKTLSISLRRDTSNKEGSMKLAVLLFASLVVLALSGCSAVYVTQPMGEKPWRIEAQDWDGTWIHKEGSVTVKVLDGENGVLRIASIEPKEKDLVFETHDVQLRQSGSCIFASTKADSSTDEPRYLWARLKRDGKQVIVWLPAGPEFKALVQAQKLPGRSEGESDVILDNLESRHLSIIAREQEGVLFAWDEPIVFLRFSGKGD